MSLGIHSFYVFPRPYNQIDKLEEYFIGRYIGDSFNDPAFNALIKSVQNKLHAKFGLGYTCFWSSGIIKPYKPLTEEQKCKKAITKASNIHKKKALQIIQDNTLFTDDFLYEEINRHQNRIEILKKRYNQDEN